ncbi:MAG TPA: SEL1-like repeat protein [Klebsiella sp.]|jgi:TPR repeat protein
MGIFFEPYQAASCCLCGSDEALTGEHKIKALALRKIFGKNARVIVMRKSTEMIKKIACTLLFGMCIPAFGYASDEVDRLYDRIEQKDIAALSSLNELGDRNDPQALSVLGFIYEFGVSVPKNVEQAIGYYQKACEHGGNFGCSNASYFYQYSVGVPQDLARAHQLNERLKIDDIQNVEIFFELRDKFYEGKAAAEKDVSLRPRLIEYLSRFLTNSDEETQVMLNRMGIGQRDALRLARFWAKDGNPDLLFSVGHFYNFDYSYEAEKNIEALKWFQRAAEAGNAESQNILGIVYQRGDWGTKMDPQLAIQWFERAGKQGDYDALINLGEIYYLGEIVRVDYNRALALFEQAYKDPAIDRSRPAKHLSWMYYYGQSVAVNCAKAWDYRVENRGSSHNDQSEKNKFIRACKNDEKEREKEKINQALPILTLNQSSIYFGGNGGALKCELEFDVNTDKLAEITNLRIQIVLTNDNGMKSERTLAFPHFGLNTMNERLSNPEGNSFLFSTLLPMETSDFCQRSDFTYQVKTATATVRGQEMDLLQHGILKPNIPLP